MKSNSITCGRFLPIKWSSPWADPGFLNREGAKDYVYTSRALSKKSLMTGIQGLPNDPGSSRVLDALSCCLSLILKHSDRKFDFKNIVDQILEGVHACCTPAWIRYCSHLSKSPLCGGDCKGRYRILKGVPKTCSGYHKREAQNTFHSTGSVWLKVKGTGSSKVLNALSR